MFQSRQAILFDLDGTLVDASQDLAHALNQTLSDDGLAGLSHGEVSRMIGDGAPKLVNRAYRSRRAPEPASALERFKAYYDACCLDASHPYPGIVSLLEGLSEDGRQLAVVTNKPTSFSERILEGLGLGGFFEGVIGPELVLERKPSPLHVEAGLERLSCDAGQAVMVGDGSTDLLAGRAAGTGTIAVLWGFRSRQELAEAGPDAFAESVDELSSLLLPA